MAVIVNKSEAGKHPYRAFKVIPDAGSSFRMPSKEEVVQRLKERRNRLADYNRALIPHELHQEIIQEEIASIRRARAKDVCSRPNTQSACQPPAS